MLVSIPLPPAYRSADIFSFHSRDAEGVAEQVTPGRLRKGVLVEGVPVLLEVDIGGDLAACTVHTDGALSASAQRHIEEALQSILGLRIDPAPFLAAAEQDRLLGELTRRQGPLRIVQSASVFEALTWAIIGQQINLPFAIALRRTFILQAGRQHSSGIWCYPEAADVARLDAGQLTTRKFSRSKADTLLRVAQQVQAGALSLDPGAEVEAASRALLAVKGIGPWTVNYALLRGYGYPDCSLEGDVAIRTALHRLLGGDERPGIPAAQRLLERYAPHRTMAAAYLWASLGEQTD